ncbi:cellulose binding domain-containing protein [Streptomyces thermoviolaceus]|uniref:cellulose binding domain-containing protein n=1 Tax=Streptomyces thermoviolaceus TaxID=1952 RepID=UPI0019863136|nr:cellulose binding domain-containing protein [Streptomyces thermoviolaceus]GGV68141.1 alpha-L-arabinofuranosidase [Streptomyces thermoviolaceus subsp. apingens]
MHAAASPLHRAPGRLVRRLLRGPAAVRRAAAGAVTAALLAAAGLAPAGSAEAAAPAAVDVTVDTRAGLGTVPDTAYGLNSAIWDAEMNTTATQDLIEDAGVGMLRYPGGSYGDIYHWRTHTAPGGYVAPGTDFDSFMGTVKKVGAQPIVIANYGSGTPEEAADWVRYANIDKGYGVRYWEVGNELYGNGHYGAGWETDEHEDTSPTAYAHGVVDFVSAMKAVDPDIEVGAVLTTPGNWPDGVIGEGDSADWNHTVIPIVAGKADFVVVHWYPGGSDAAGMLTTPAQLAGELQQLRAELDAAGAEDTPIALTETNSNLLMDTQPTALFAADTYLTALENGVFTVDWWNTHNGVGEISTAPDGATDYGDMGLLSSGGCAGSVCEPPVNTPFPPYYALQLVSRTARPGDQLVAAGSADALVSAHAVLRSDGDLSVLLINRDPSASRTARLRLNGFTPDGSPAELAVFRDLASSIDTSTGDAAGVTLPPWSVTAVTLHPKDGTASALSAPGTPKVTAVTDTTATLSWPASTGGRPVRYEIYRQHGAASELLTDTTGTTATVRNLEPGSTHTLSVLARDADGRLSRASDPVTVRTTSPAESTCQVAYRVTEGWGNGFNAQITVTHTGDTAIDGWTLSYAFPDSGVTVTGYWNAKVVQSGRNVIVTPESYNATLAPHGGNAVSFGFTAANYGAYAPPAVFRLNGTVCTTT